jgi:two-component system response regulator YesN
MVYKVFLVEDEIVTREGIRDHVNWGAAGFEFCGEAPDGELALPLIEEAKPDVLITDIKMPFMDGLQLSKIVREHMPWVKIIILSGHNEFEYAQSAVKLGVTEYLLKPISSQDLHQVLVNLAKTLDHESHERQQLKNLQINVEYNLDLNREKFLLKLVMGGISSAEAIDQSQQLGLNIVARHYLVGLLRIELCSDAQPFDYYEYERVKKIVSDFARNNLDVFITRKDMGELVFLLKGDSPDQIIQDGRFLAGLIKKEIEAQAACTVIMELGTPQQHLGDIHFSFAEALTHTKGKPVEPGKPAGRFEKDLIELNHIEIKDFLKFGSFNQFDPFYSQVLEAVGRLVSRSYYVKHYLYIDIILTIAQFISDLGGDVDEVLPELQQIEEKLNRIHTPGDFEHETRALFSKAFSYRNNKVNQERFAFIQQAKTYLDNHYGESTLRMEDIAQRFNLSPSHFSTVFRQQVGITFRAYLRDLRMIKAKELLKTTNLKCAEVAYRCGYNDPHYFSFVFKKNTGQTPKEFQSQSQEL